MKKPLLTTLTFSSVVALSALSAHSFAGENPFTATTLKAGYQLAQADTKMAEGKCGESKTEAEGKCGDKKVEGKCGEGKCGAEKKAAEEKAAAEGKAAEGKCGEGKMPAEGKCGEKK